MLIRRLLVPFLMLLISAFSIPLRSQDLPNLPPLSAGDLLLKDNPAAPGASAMILYLAVETDNLKSTEQYSYRIKIFTDEGKKWANIEIPYLDKETRIEEFRARTIGVDGKVLEVTERPLDHEVVKAKKYRVNVKTLAIPDVQAGTIIEYSYRYHFHGDFPDWLKDTHVKLLNDTFVYPAAHWTVQRNLFLRHGHFLLRRAKGLEIHEHEIGLPESLKKGLSNSSNNTPATDGSPSFPIQNLPKDTVLLEVDNIPAFEEEEFTLPEESLKARVDLYYAASTLSIAGFWADVGRRYSAYYEAFMAKPKAMRKEIDKLLSPGDSEEVKLRKIYARVQKIKPADAEGTKSDKELKQEKLKDNNDVEDVLTRGYAFGHQIDLLFIALAREAGFRAFPILLTSRQHGEFIKDYPDERQLNTMVAAVRVGGALHFFDPETPFCPYVLLPWYEAGASGVLIAGTGANTGGIAFPKIEDAHVQLDADLQLSPEGTLSGTVKVRFEKQEALVRRQAAILDDEPKRRETLEEYLKDRLLSAASVKLTTVQGWDTSEGSLDAEYAVEIPNIATATGRRMILPQAIFHTNGKNPLASTHRIHPIMFDFPSQVDEFVRIRIPDDFTVDAMPAPFKTDQGAVYYEISAQKDGASAMIKRTFRLASCVFEQKEYANLRIFYERVLTGDAQQIAIRHSATANAR